MFGVMLKDPNVGVQIPPPSPMRWSGVIVNAGRKVCSVMFVVSPHNLSIAAGSVSNFLRLFCSNVGSIPTPRSKYARVVQW